MSRVHDALRRAGQMPPAAGAPATVPARALDHLDGPGLPHLDLEGLLDKVKEIPFSPAPEALLVDASHAAEAPTEEFRTLRTRLNHMQHLQPVRTTVVTSPSPAEGKLEGNLTLLADFDFRRPVVHHLLQTDRAPGITDYLLGKIPLHQAIRRISGSNLYIMPAGE